MTSRRLLLAGTAIGLMGAVAPRWRSGFAAAGVLVVTHSDAEWSSLLSPEQYAVLRQNGTERPFSSPLLEEHRAGTFACGGCARDLFASAAKYDSRTGWPSFWAPLEGAVAEVRDTTAGMLRTAVQCSRCSGHLGHVFNDGPKPTGLRYCMNGIAMIFKPATA